MTSLPTRIRMCPYILAVAGALLHIGPQAPAALISINNTSSSLYEIRDESAGNATVVPQNTNQREATQTYALTDAHNYRLHLGQVGDQGSHFFKVPEPAALGTLALGALLFTRRRRYLDGCVNVECRRRNRS